MRMEKVCSHRDPTVFNPILRRDREAVSQQRIINRMNTKRLAVFLSLSLILYRLCHFGEIGFCWNLIPILWWLVESCVCLASSSVYLFIFFFSPTFKLMFLNENHFHLFLLGLYQVKSSKCVMLRNKHTLMCAGKVSLFNESNENRSFFFSSMWNISRMVISSRQQRKNQPEKKERERKKFEMKKILCVFSLNIPGLKKRLTLMSITALIFIVSARAKTCR